MYKFLKYELVDNVAIVTLNDPDNMNALSFALLDELYELLGEIESDSSVRALLLWGSEKVFCAGGNLKDMDGVETVKQAYNIAQKTHRAYSRLSGLSCPTIAAIAGPALGGGLEIALTCDLRIGNEKTKMGLPEVSLGLMPGGGGTQRLPRIVGISKALEMMFTGTIITAEEALKIGLLNSIVPVGEIYKEGLEMATKLAKMAPNSLQLIKKVTYTGYGAPLSVGLEEESRCFAAIFNTKDSNEGIRAFLEKREPNYTGE